ncbi:hypothetical protein ACFCV3_06490 [Kribbella sp. NPDC056345]|uniref:hypothetical protein n=1 Tax=Kribbella sp. NPDC056345 TaxID=3345789 RepID=UPI0035D73988
MSDQQPTQMPNVPQGYVPPQAQELTVGYRRGAVILLWLAIIIAVFMVVAFVTSVVFLVQADADTSKAALGYIAIVLWVAIGAAVPVLLAVGIPGVVMTRRVRRHRQAGITTW